MIPEIDLARVRRWIEGRNAKLPERQVRYERDVTDRAITILEYRPPWRPERGPEWTPASGGSPALHQGERRLDSLLA